MPAGRPRIPGLEYRMVCHKCNGYLYAATKYTDKDKSGRSSTRYRHWGTLDDKNEFHPNIEFIMLPESERSKFKFPEDWVITKVQQLNESARLANAVIEDIDNKHSTDQNQSDEQNPSSDGNTCNVACISQRQVFDAEAQFNNRLYGATWFLTELARKENVVEDLLVTFEYNEAVVNDILTLAMFPYLTGWNFDRVEKWQKYTKTPSEGWLTPSYITRFTQSITDNHRMQFFKLRMDRLGDKSVVACDSTTRSAYGKCLADIHWGSNKDNEALENTLEVVVYSLTSHEPIYYRTFPGNMMDARTVRTIVSDLNAVGVKDLIVVLDRGYGSDVNFLEMYESSLPFLVCAKTNQEPVLSCIQKIEYNLFGLPSNMSYDKETCSYYTQYDISDASLELGNGTVKSIPGLKCNVYLDMHRRLTELQDISTTVDEECGLWKKRSSFLQVKDITESHLKNLTEGFRYHHAQIIPEKKDRKGVLLRDRSVILIRKQDQIDKDQVTAGFYSSVSYGTPGDALEQSRTYALRDEQEKYFSQMKDQMNFHTQDCSSEDGKTGRLFILFIGLILSSKVKYIWKNNVDLRKVFRTTLSMLDEMASIRYCDYPNQENHMTSFLQPQVDICRAFDIEVPYECLSTIEQRKMRPKKRPGRKAGSGSASNKAP